MSYSEQLVDYRKTNHLTQEAAAKQIPVDRSLWNKWEKGLPVAEHHEPALSKANWKLALEVIEKQTGGWIKNRFGNVDPTPTALQLRIAMEMDELKRALGEIILSNDVDWSKRIDDLERLKKENDDVNEVSLVFKGVLAEMIQQAKKGGRQ
ncbi:MAG TPA: hypothetical protein VF199_12500 [Bacillales bacterium]